MKVKLAALPNPDFPPDVPQGSLEIPEQWVEVRSFAHASQVCRQYIETNGLGGGNWSGGEVATDDDQPLAYVSYNGRVWKDVHSSDEIVG